MWGFLSHSNPNKNKTQLLYLKTKIKETKIIYYIKIETSLFEICPISKNIRNKKEHSYRTYELVDCLNELRGLIAILNNYM